MNNNAEAKGQDLHRSLAPCILTDKDPAYKSVAELAHAMSLPECKNIALTGVFGSGKSSIINTYLKDENAPQKDKVLRISLSNFSDDNIKKEDEKQYEDNIEYKIFQHILYKADNDKTRESCYRRLQVENRENIKNTIILSILYFFCFVVLFEPECLQVDSFYDAYHFIFGSLAQTINIISDILACATMVYLSYKGLIYIMRRLGNIKIENIKASEIEISIKKTSSVFSNLLDELLYFFKAGEYELVVFEDLDRINNPQNLFLKLREINILINESHYYLKSEKIIRFLYAIKDDVFHEEVRTKFFDYIIPVVPVVNSFNAGEYILTNYKKILNEISMADVKRLGLFVTRMRDLTNIMNEYILYKDTIFSEPMSAKKLLALTIYKNLYPKDYSMVHEKKGLLYSIFYQKDIFSTEIILSKTEEIKKLKEAINKEQDELTNNRLMVLNQLYSTCNITDLVIKGFKYSLNDIASIDFLYEEFENDHVESYIIDDPLEPEIGKYNEKFEDLRKAVDPDDMYYVTVDGHKRAIYNNSDKVRKLENEIYSIKSKSLREQMKLKGDGNSSYMLMRDFAVNLFKDEEDKNEESISEMVKTLHGLIRGGYISDDYSTYISYTYKGSFGENEFNFQQSVIQGIPLEYNFPLNNIESFINNISTESYEEKCILNFDLLNYILDKKLNPLIEVFVNTTRRYPDFIVSYDNSDRKREDFFNFLFDEWTFGIFNIRSIKDNSVRTYMLKLLFKYAPSNLKASSEDLDFLKGQYKFIADNFDESNKSIFGLIRQHGLKFKDLIEPNSQTVSLYNYVKDNNYYEINYNNLRVIYGQSFDISSYTSICAGTESIKIYLTSNINYLVSLFPNSDTKESSDALNKLAAIKDLTNDNLISLLRRQENKVSTLTYLEEERSKALLEEDLVEPSWEVVRYAFNNMKEKDSLVNFIDRHASELSMEKMKEGDDELQKYLLNSNERLSLESYFHIAKSADYYVELDEFPDIAEERLSILIDCELIEYGINATKLIAEYSPTVFAKYMIMYFDKIIEDKDKYDFKVSNGLGIEILKSNLSDTQKAKFLSEFAVFWDLGDKEEYAYLILKFYHDNDIAEETERYLIEEALMSYHPEGSWKLRIDIINKIHQVFPYSEDRTKAIVDSLGEPYTELNTYARQTFLDNNPENNELVSYLSDKAPYISKIKPMDNNQIKVTYKHGGSSK